jgi:hypothetical protein
MRQFTISWLATLLYGLVVGLGTPAYAAQLFGVTGDGARVDPESFFSVSIVDAQTTFLQALGNGIDGESIALNSTDGLMYHWSGISPDLIMETINLNDQIVTNIPTNFSFYDPVEVFGSTFDPSTGNFLFTDTNANLGSVTPGGDFSLIGPLPDSLRGLAFNGGKLYGSAVFSDDTLYELDPNTGGSISSVTVVLSGFIVQGINALTTDPSTGILYAIMKTAGHKGRRLATIDPLTGFAADVGLLPDGFANIEFGPTEQRVNFLCYKAKSAKGERKFGRLDVDLEDQFGATTRTVKKPKFLCTPVAKDGESVIDPAGHLVCYEVKRLRGQPKFQKRNVLVFNQFEDEVEGRILTIEKPRILCVSSTKEDLGVVGDDDDKHKHKSHKYWDKDWDKDDD